MPRLNPSAPWLMVGSTLLFSLMGVCVKYASQYGYAPGEIVFYRGLFGALFLFTVSRIRGGTLATRYPMLHLKRGAIGVFALMLWFYAIAWLPLATAITLNYMSSIWMALFLLGGALMFRGEKVDPRLVITVLIGFGGVALVLQPSMESDQFLGAGIGLASGMMAAVAYLQVQALGKVGEPEYRVVFYFSLGSMLTGLASTFATGMHSHTPTGVLLLAATAILATLAQMLLTRAYTIGRALSNASLQYLGIAWSFVFGVVLFHDPVTMAALGGMVLIVGAGLGSTLLRARQPGSAKDDSGDRSRGGPATEAPEM